MPRKTTDTTPSFQTARLSRGSHVSPDHGVCVMELASMLAGERFGDHPRSVSPVIGAFLRAYNDLIDDDRRQDLFRYAADCVGTRSSRDAEHTRAALLPPETDTGLRARLGRCISLPARRRAARASGAAIAMSRTPERHADALELLERLITAGAPPRAPRDPVPDEVLAPLSARASSRS